MVPHIKKRLAAALNHCQGTQWGRECKYITRNIICTYLQVYSQGQIGSQTVCTLVKQRSVVWDNDGALLICDYLRGSEKKKVSECENMEIALSSKNLTACALIALSVKVSHF